MALSQNNSIKTQKIRKGFQSWQTLPDLCFSGNLSGRLTWLCCSATVAFLRFFPAKRDLTLRLPFPFFTGFFPSFIICDKNPSPLHLLLYKPFRFCFWYFSYVTGYGIFILEACTGASLPCRLSDFYRYGHIDKNISLCQILHFTRNRLLWYAIRWISREEACGS